MKEKNKALIDKYIKLKNKKIPRWEETIKEEKKVINCNLINNHMDREIEELRSYISKLKNISTRIVNLSIKNGQDT